MENVRTVDELMEKLNSLADEMSGKKKTPSAAELRKAENYRRAFWEHMHTGLPENDLKEGSDGSGGYLVPDEYETKLVQALEEQNILRKLGHVFPTTRKIKIPIVLGEGNATWMPENAPYRVSDIDFGQVEISAYKLAARLLVSDELLEDSAVDLESLITELFKAEMNDAEETAFFTGDGNGKPLGLVYQTPVGTETEEAGKISMDDILDLIYSVTKPFRAKSVLVMSERTYWDLRKIRVHNGRYVWNPDLQKDGYDTLFGYRVYTTKNLPDPESGARPVLFGDVDYYWIGDRGKRVIKRLVERYADHGQVGYLVSQRVDAKLVFPEAIKALEVR